MRSDLFFPLALSWLSAAAAATTTTVNLVIPPTHALPNPRSLPPQTHAKLSSFHFDASAYLSPANTFAFHNVSEGSYLLDVHSPSHAFAPLRVDVLPVVSGAGQTEKEERTAKLKVAAWETYRGNDWNNKGEAAVVTNSGALEVKVLGLKNFYMERSSCRWPRGSDLAVDSANPTLPVNVLSILKNPMILLGLVSMGIFFGMPYLVDNSTSLDRSSLQRKRACHGCSTNAKSNSGPRNEKGMGREPEEQPHEQPHGWSARGTEPYGQLRHGRVPSRVLKGQQRQWRVAERRQEVMASLHLGSSTLYDRSSHERMTRWSIVL